MPHGMAGGSHFNASVGTISLGYGIISDITTPSERGFYVSLMLLG